MNKKRIVSIFMALCVIAGLVFGTQTEVSAKSPKPLTVGFKGKTITLIKDLNADLRMVGGDTPKLQKLKQKWGKPSKTEDLGNITAYTWKKGKTSIEITDYDAVDGGLGSIQIDIQDKNASLCGVKVGMKKAEAVKKIKKALGSKPTKQGKYLMADAGVYMPISFELKNGKISAINWVRS